MHQKTSINSMIFIIAVACCIMVSFKMEYILYQDVIPGNLTSGDWLNNSVSIALLVALGFNAGKIVLAWILATGTKANKAVSVAVMFFLIIISAIATLIVISSSIHESNMDNTIADAKNMIVVQYGEREKSLANHYYKEARNIRDRYLDIRYNLESRASKTIAKYEALRDEQVKYKFKGSDEFIGPKYKEYDRLVVLENETLKEDLQQINLAEAREKAALNVERRNASQQLLKSKSDKINQENHEKYSNTDIVQNQRIMPLLQLINDTFKESYTAMHFALLISLLITLVIELLPMALILYLAQISKNKALPANNIATIDTDKTTEHVKQESDTKNITPLRHHG